MKSVRTSKDDPEFVDKFFKNSRLHFIGSWKTRYQEILDSLPPPPHGIPPPPPAGFERVVFHVDMDAFFASCCTVGRPELKGKPLAICHSSGVASGSNSEVSTCNYEARKFGVKKGMWLGEARRLCPHLVARPYEFGKYETVAEAVYRELFAVTPWVAGLSCDEALLDVTAQCFAIATGSEPPLEPPLAAATTTALPPPTTTTTDASPTPSAAAPSLV
eukprot:CAMPEP_0171746180 /NCGR_PEP_ID=MMETSP0991-20121206/38635_1 /TAXON_ID=483369 /ORGANISM="non described non described, Strain CCMP2098" /LENGTH=217 /DNA_ID=CAMNT_0012345859 /DNA_START=99 /DNA_END=748 /DNA_ORIENTATION=-